MIMLVVYTLVLALHDASFCATCQRCAHYQLVVNIKILVMYADMDMRGYTICGYTVRGGVSVHFAIRKSYTRASI